LQT
jgi:hypothetical protein